MEFLEQIPYFYEALSIILALKVAANTIVNLTPTPVDNSIVAFVYRMIEFVAGIVTPKAKSPNPSLESKPDNVDLFDK